MRKLFGNLFGRNHLPSRRPPSRHLSGPEQLERREVFDAAPLPVLMVIADQRDFYYQEYNDTRLSLEAAGLDVDVAATTTDPSTPHPGTGQGSDGGIVTPDLRLDSVQASDYSAIVFVGGWGSSMYQYSFSGTYTNAAYNGDTVTKEIVNGLINDFADQDKPVSAICHGVTVLAWARVDGTSPIDGRLVAVPWVGSPANVYNGQTYLDGELMQNVQVIANGATTPSCSGAIGDPATVADDVVVDGRIITAENYDSAALFGRVIAAEVLAALPDENNAPVVSAATFTLAENSPVGTEVGGIAASDPDAGQQLAYSITGGNTGGAFAINSVTGRITSIAVDPLDYETNPVFELIVTATDNGNPPLSSSAVITVLLTDVDESVPPPPVAIVDGNLVIHGTPLADRIFVLPGRGSGELMVWRNGSQSGPYIPGPKPHIKVFSGAGNDFVSVDQRVAIAAEIDGGWGNDWLSGGTGQDELIGGEGDDRLFGNDGDDLLFGGSGDDEIRGGAGRDLLIGGLGDDWLHGGGGLDILIGNTGNDRLHGGAREDQLHAGNVDRDDAALLALLQEWSRSHHKNEVEVLSWSFGVES